jgi:hypothetical protein
MLGQDIDDYKYYGVVNGSKVELRVRGASSSFLCRLSFAPMLLPLKQCLTQLFSSQENCVFCLVEKIHVG